LSATTFKTAWREDDTVIYIDVYSNKHAAKGGNLAWRINNPGFIRHHCHAAKKNGSIGAWEQFSIFSNPLQGHNALREWLHSEKFYQSDLYTIGNHYQPLDSTTFVQNLSAASNIPSKTKLKDITKDEFEMLLFAIEKQCGFVQVGSEEFGILPKIVGKIECIGKEELYLLGNDITLTKSEVVNWVASQRLDAVVVHKPTGTHIRSRPAYHMQNFQLTLAQHNESAGALDTLIRTVGEKAPNQCVWGFINGIFNEKEDAVYSCGQISKKAGNELVFSLTNDMCLRGAIDASIAIILKLGIDAPIVKNAVLFLKHLLSIAKNDASELPVIVFVHSQGAAIAEHAIRLLEYEESQKIRIFTFGGWSFITPGVAHPDSHNYTSIRDMVPRIGSCNLQCLATRKYEDSKEGLNEEDTISRLALEDVLHHLDSLDPQTRQRYVQARSQLYRKWFEKIRNVTIVPSGALWEHSFNSDSYQNIVTMIVEKYRKNHQETALARLEKSLVAVSALGAI